MNKRVTALLAIWLPFGCQSRSYNSNKETAAPRYVASKSKEATLSFDGEVRFSSRKPPALQDASDKIEAQVIHMFGSMAMMARKAVPKENHRITAVTVKVVDAATNLYSASYRYEGTVAIEHGPDSYEVLLPINPDTIFEESRVGSFYPCTDSHYNTKDDFWYFWSPSRSGCQLKRDQHYKAFVAKITPGKTPQLEKSYPEYARLVDSNGEVQIVVLHGLYEAGGGWEPRTSQDHDAVSTRRVLEQIQEMGFKPVKRWKEADFTAFLARHSTQPPALNKIMGGEPFSLPYVEDFEKVYPSGSRYKKMKLRMFFGETGIDERSTAFHYLFKDALESASLMIYTGHSGLGGHLDLDTITRINRFKVNFNPNKYQIYFFNSCTSYTYYNTMYFKPKRTPQDTVGSKSLDIFTNGLATYTTVTPNVTMALLSTLDKWGTSGVAKTYQQLATEIDSNNLFGINGDEDNPPVPAAGTIF